MNSKNCLTEQDLTLHYYNELDENRSRHLAGCQRCAERLATLTTELAALPKPDCTADALAGVRMAARVKEKLTNSPTASAGCRRLVPGPWRSWPWCITFSCIRNRSLCR